MTLSKGEKERYTHLNAEFQRIPRRDKKAFLSDQCKEIEENNRMGKTRDLFIGARSARCSGPLAPSPSPQSHLPGLAPYLVLVPRDLCSGGGWWEQGGPAGGWGCRLSFGVDGQWDEGSAGGEGGPGCPVLSVLPKALSLSPMASVPHPISPLLPSIPVKSSRLCV